jgi:hypothetical protein
MNDLFVPISTLPLATGLEMMVLLLPTLFLAFVFWIGWIGLKLLAMALLKLGVWPGSNRKRPNTTSYGPCPDPVCRSLNPSRAVFCRRCGRQLLRAPAPARVRR